MKCGLRRVSTGFRPVLVEFSEFFSSALSGLLIQTSVGTAAGLGLADKPSKVDAIGGIENSTVSKMLV